MFAKLSCAVGAGLCVAAFPGSLAWLVPGAALGLIVVYENTTPEQERRNLLTAARALLPGPLAADLAAFGQLPAKAKARYLLAGDVPLRPAQQGQGPAAPGMFDEADLRDALASNERYALSSFVRRTAEESGFSTAEVYAEVERVQRAWAQEATRAPDPLFAALESRPHRLIIGHTGGGKTTLIHNRATSWAAAGQHVIVCDPDAAPGQWPGCTVAGSGDDYAGIARALATVDNEFKRRSSARSAGQRRFTPAHLVIDELQETIDHVYGAWNIIEPVLRRGRKLGLHVTLGVQDDQVETLGLHGKSHLLRNTVTVELYQDDRGVRQAAIKNRITDGRPLQTYAVPTLASPEDLIVAPEPELPTLVRRAPLPPLPPNGHEPCQWCNSLYDCACDEGPAVSVAARPAAALTLAELAQLAPSLAAKRGYRPTDQERAALAGLLEIDDLAPAQTVTIDRESGNVIVNVQQITPVAPAPTELKELARASQRPRMFKLKRDQRTAREHYYQDAAARGITFEQAYREEPRPKGNRNQMRDLFLAAKG